MPGSPIPGPGSQDFRRADASNWRRRCATLSQAAPDEPVARKGGSESADASSGGAGWGSLTGPGRLLDPTTFQLTARCPGTRPGVEPLACGPDGTSLALGPPGTGVSSGSAADGTGACGRLTAGRLLVPGTGAGCSPGPGTGVSSGSAADRNDHAVARSFPPRFPPGTPGSLRNGDLPGLNHPADAGRQILPGDRAIPRHLITQVMRQPVLRLRAGQRHLRRAARGPDQAAQADQVLPAGA